MAYLALYRKYRPTTFDGVIGQEHIVKTLTNQILNDRLGHAYLFTGTRGTGKTSTAKIFAKAINCQNSTNGSPCGKCPSCLALSQPSNLDIIEIDAASNNGVNEIRELRENVQFPPVSCKYKVYIIDEVHMLTGAAFNALLKTLEEPPKHAVFILATTEAYKIPATILSRCMRFDFRLISTEKIAELISKIFDEQHKEYEKEAIYAIASAGEGSIRDALSIADTAFSYSVGKLTYNDVLEIIGSTNIDLLNEFIICLSQGNAEKTLKIIDNLCGMGKSIGVLIKDVQSLLRNLMIIKTCKNANDILLLPQSRFDELVKISGDISENKLLFMLEIFTKMEGEIKYSVNPRITFEAGSLKSAMPETEYSIDALLVRIKELELKLQNIISNGVKIVDTDENNFVKEVANIEETQVDLAKPSSSEKISLIDMSDDELKAKLLFGLRSIGSEMLWNLVQNVTVKKDGNLIKLLPQDENDRQVLIIEDNVEKIKLALENINFSEISVEEIPQKKKLDKIDEASERLKKIFGSDIVIIK